MAFITSPTSILIAVIVTIGVAAFTWMTVQDRTYVASMWYAPRAAPNPNVAVIYYSRSGHSEAVARYVARQFNAPIAKIEADYPLDLSGQQKAIEDANAAVIPKIIVQEVELDSAHQVILVTPTWMFRPATPMWAYIAQTDLRNKAIILITTGNSRFEQDQIDEFAKAVESQGGRLVRHIFLRRGRFYWQKSREDLLQELSAQLRTLDTSTHTTNADRSHLKQH